MKSVVTGCAGFIGSHLCERLLSEGHRVLGIDALRDYYDVRIKRGNLKTLLAHPRFTFVHGDVRRHAARARGADFVFHQAAQPGVRASWGMGFQQYTVDNVSATQELLEAVKSNPPRRFIYASSSSVYGAARPPMREDGPTRPISPYGVTKLAAEHLCLLYHRLYGVPVTALRYFTVYGPRQRPDMAIHKFIRAVLAGRPLTLYGTGRQTRDFTYVDDAVEANMLAMRAVRRVGAASSPPVVGEIFNIGGGTRISVLDVIHLIEKITGRQAKIHRLPVQHGDAPDTGADTSRARRLLGFRPATPFAEGLAREVEWLKSLPAYSVRTPG